MTSTLQTITLYSNDPNTLDTNVNTWIIINDSKQTTITSRLMIKVKDVTNYAFFNNNLLEPVFLATIKYELVSV